VHNILYKFDNTQRDGLSRILHNYCPIWVNSGVRGPKIMPWTTCEFCENRLVEGHCFSLGAEVKFNLGRYYETIRTVERKERLEGSAPCAKELIICNGADVSGNIC